MLGGVSTNTGTVPSKTLRAAIVELTGRAASVYGNAYRVKHEITIDDLLWRTQQVIEHEQRRDRRPAAPQRRARVRGHGVVRRPAHAGDRSGGRRASSRRAERIVIARRHHPGAPAGVEFDDRTVLDSDGILHLAELPRTLTVIGGGVIGLEYASMAAALGVQRDARREAPAHPRLRRRRARRGAPVPPARPRARRSASARRSRRFERLRRRRRA